MSKNETDRSDDYISVDRRPPEETFQLIADDNRVAILQAMMDAPHDVVSFSTLRERVGVKDSGQFNYHLKQLLGTFLRKREDGYELTHAGNQIVGAIQEGSFNTEATIEAIPLDWTCINCDEALDARYSDGRASFHCRACDDGASFVFPPGNLEGVTREALPAVFARWYHQLITRIRTGFCHICAGPLAWQLIVPDVNTDQLEKERNFDVTDLQYTRTVFDCDRCGSYGNISLASYLTHHPIVAGFFAEHGLELTERHPSQIWQELDAFDTEVRSEDPLSVEGWFIYGDEKVRAEIGPDVEITAIERTAVEPES